MKKLLTAAIIFAACATLYAGTWSRNGKIETVNTVMSATTPAPEDALESQTINLAMRDEEVKTAEEEIATVTSAEGTPAPEAEAVVTAAESPATAPVIASQTTPPSSGDPYHTDVYPENVYSEKYEYTADGNLIGKTTTYPTAFGPDTIWIDGKAYGDVPGFGLVEWGGPSSVTEDYTMYENGNKIGIMGGEDDASAHTSAPTQQVDCPEPTGEVIDQTITEAPERSSTPPNYKPDTTPPDDPDAIIIS